ncbi:MAG: DUF2255 family protein [Myxococcota bacterium]|nr:DUF2255 family protein [Myxococcota bacterium]
MRSPSLLGVVLVTGLVISVTGCLSPKDRRPGLSLSGPTEAFPADWSFTDAHREIWIETRTPWLLRHSVTIVCAQRDGQLFVGARNPETKRWVSLVERDDRVRIEVDGVLYEARLDPIADPAEEARVRRAYAAKYGWPERPASERPPWRSFRVLPRGVLPRG